MEEDRGATDRAREIVLGLIVDGAENVDGKMNFFAWGGSPSVVKNVEVWWRALWARNLK